jgi:hypothetical protein
MCYSPIKNYSNQLIILWCLLSHFKTAREIDLISFDAGIQQQIAVAYNAKTSINSLFDKVSNGVCRKW